MEFRKANPMELAEAKVLARAFTAWIIDVGNAIRTGNLEDRISALSQAEDFIQKLDEVGLGENS